MKQETFHYSAHLLKEYQEKVKLIRQEGRWKNFKEFLYWAIDNEVDHIYNNTTGGSK